MATEVISNAPLFESGADGNYLSINTITQHLANTGYVSVIDRDENDPTNISAPSNGEAWYVAASPTNDWAGHAGEFAFYYDGWIFRSIRDGEVFSILDEGTGGSGKSVWFNDGGTLIKLHDP